MDIENTAMNEVKRLPYGVANFEYVMKENCYYVDKTIYIPQLEAQPNNYIKSSSSSVDGR